MQHLHNRNNCSSPLFKLPVSLIAAANICENYRLRQFFAAQQESTVNQMQMLTNYMHSVILESQRRVFSSV